MRKPFFFSAIILCTAFALYAERSIVTGIQVVAGKSARINVSWILPADNETEISKILVFKSIKPISSSYDLIGLAPAAELKPDTSAWTDNVKDYSEYYYAVIAESGGRRNTLILPSINSTVKGVRLHIPEKKTQPERTASAEEKIYSADANRMRETPLPILEISGLSNRKKIEMSKNAKIAAKTLAGSIARKRTERLNFYVFEEDLISPDGGDDFLLFEILRKYFIQKKYAESIDYLEKLLGTNISESVENRARFYLAESYYFSQNYEKAVLTFLPVYDKFPPLAKKWIDSSFDLMPPPADK